MQTPAAEKNPTPPRVLLYSQLETKDDVDEKLERGRVTLARLIVNVNASERETHDILTTAACKDQKTHDDICLGLLGNILTDPPIASKCFRDLSFLNRDSLNVVMELLVTISTDKYLKLTDIARAQLLWIVKELMKTNVSRTDEVSWALMRQIAGGDVTNRNLWLAEFMLDSYQENMGWLEKYPILIGSVIYTYLRIIEDHHAPSLASFRQKEINFVVFLIREHFTEMCMNQQIGLGRDFLRLLQAVSRIPEFETLWRDIFNNPKALSPHLTGINQLLNVRTSRKYLQSRLTPDMEKKIIFLTSHVRFGMQKRYQEWLQRQYFSTPESQSLRADIIRYIVGVIHPSNEILCSDILPRWAVIGWLLTTCTNPVAAANAKLALFFDWLVFDPAKDNIMNIEPGILVMYHSLKPHLAITATLLDFLIRLTYEYWPGGTDKIKSGVGSALRTIMEKKVLASLDPVLQNPKLDTDLRNSINKHLMVLLRTEVLVQNHQLEDTTFNNVPVLNNLLLPGPPTIVKNNNCVGNNTVKFESQVDDADFSDEIDDELVTIISNQQEKVTAVVAALPVVEPELPLQSDETDRSLIFQFAQSLAPDLRIPVENLLKETSRSVRSEYLDDIAEELVDVALDADSRNAISKCFLFVYKSDLQAQFLTRSDRLIEDLTISPVSELLSFLIKMRPSDKSLKMKNLMRLMTDIISAIPSMGYKILILLQQMLDRTQGSKKNSDTFAAVYRNLCHYRGLKLETQLQLDIQNCFEYDPVLLGFLCPTLYSWYESDMLGSAEILHLIVSTLDPTQMVGIMRKVMQGQMIMFDENHLLPILIKSLDWEAWEQTVMWNLVKIHRYAREDLLPLVMQFETKGHPEAFLELVLLLTRTKPTQEVLGPLFCRRVNPEDPFVVTVLLDWANEFEDDLSEVLAGAIVRATGSPAKRKRGLTGRSISSPAGPPTPTVEQVLGHLDQLRSGCPAVGVFSKDIMQAALLQIQSFVTDNQRVKYKELLSLAAEEPDTSKESKSIKRLTPRKTSSSPTGPASSNFTSPTPHSSLSRTRSGRTRRAPNESTDTSEDEDDIPMSKQRKRKKTAVNSDSE